MIILIPTTHLVCWKLASSVDSYSSDSRTEGFGTCDQVQSKPRTTNATNAFAAN